MKVFDELINLICSKRIEIKINVKLNDKNIHDFIPKIYYIGEGKSGSTTIISGFHNINIAHWHSVNYFEKRYKTKLLSSNNYDLYDLILYIGNKYNFKPVIIESIRNTLDKGISDIFQHIKINRKHNNECKICSIKKYISDNNINTINKIIKKYLTSIINKVPYSCIMFKKHFNIDLISSFDKDLNYYFNDTKNVYLLILKFEDIKNWNEIINNNIPYEFVLKWENKTKNIFYKKIKNNIKYTKKELQPFLDSRKIVNFYSNDEIEKIVEKFIIN